MCINLHDFLSDLSLVKRWPLAHVWVKKKYMIKQMYKFVQFHVYWCRCTNVYPLSMVKFVQICMGTNVYPLSRVHTFVLYSHGYGSTILYLVLSLHT